MTITEQGTDNGHLVEMPVMSALDIGELSGQLGRVTGALDQLQNDNLLLSDALASAQSRLQDSRGAQEAAQKLASELKRDVLRLDATVQRRDGEIVAVEDELYKLRSERTDWESVVLAERDVAIESYSGELVAARADVEALNERIAELSDELALERQRTTPDTQVVQVMTTAGTHLLIDGERLLQTAWPELHPEQRRSRIIEAVVRFQELHDVTVELVLEDTQGWDPNADIPAGVRVRVPHPGIPIPACLARLARVHGTEGPVVTVSGVPADEPWISSVRAATVMGLPIPPAMQMIQDQISESLTNDLEPTTEVEK